VMNPVWLAFGVGIFLGFMMGVFTICLMAMVKRGDDNAETKRKAG
jgi:hypothetical protein